MADGDIQVRYSRIFAETNEVDLCRKTVVGKIVQNRHPAFEVLFIPFGNGQLGTHRVR
jgi:hypothetical protein